MKILHIITSLLDGGAEGVLYRLCTNDTTNEHMVISLRGKGKYGELLTNQGVKVLTLNMKPKEFSIFAFVKLIKILKNENADIIQTWLYHADFFGGIAARLAGKKNLIWNIRHSDFNKKYTKTSLIILIKILSKLSYFLPKKIISCSKNSIKLHTNIGYQSNKMNYVPNGYDLHMFKPNPKKKLLIKNKFNIKNRFTLLGNIARFHPQKDHVNLLRALSIVKKNKIPFKCILVGFGIEKKNKILNNLIQKFNLKNELILLGQQNKINVIMNEIDVNILASGYGEAFPNVVAEAMASGTPCVVTDVGDSSLIVGDTGWVTKTSNSEELANNIKKAINKSKSKKWNYLCLKARKRIVKKFSIKKMIVSYNKIWKQTL